MAPLNGSARAQTPGVNTPTTLPAKVRISANAVSFDAAESSYYGNFAPELPGAVARKPDVNPLSDLYIKEVKPGLFFVTDGMYQSAFLVTSEGVAVFDAPETFGNKLLPAIRQHANGKPVRLLIYSHNHADHIGSAGAFSGIKDLKVVSSNQVRAGLIEDAYPGVIMPMQTFDDKATLTLGGVEIKLKTASYHSEDGDVIIYLPAQKFLMAVDTITPGEVPFMNFGATSDFGKYLKMFDVLLAYDFDTLVSGHISVIGTRQDVIDNKAYAYDVRDTVLREKQTMFDDFWNINKDMNYTNGNLAYRATIEKMRDACARQIIDRWSDRLSVVDIWAGSHCETAVVYDIMH